MNALLRSPAVYQVLLVALSIGCSNLAVPECTTSAQCTFRSDGKCVKASTGSSWCQYGDGTCPGGHRWSSEAGDGLGSTCVTAHELRVLKVDNGAGVIESDPAGIDCGGSCSAMFTDGEVVTLRATSAAGSSWKGWSGDAASCGSETICVLAMNATKTATGSFARLPDYTVEVVRAGDGSGRITSDIGDIDCGSICTHTYQTGSQVTLTATPSSGSSWSGWGGAAAACGNNTSCKLTVTQDARQVVGTFTKIPTFDLAVTVEGSADGDVKASDTSIDCGTRCAATYVTGTSVSLTATADPGARFVGWLGAAASCGTIPTCTVTLTSNLAVRAKFVTAGTAAWATRLGGSAGELVMTMTADHANYVVSAGFFSSPTFTSGLKAVSKSASLAADAFVAKQSPVDGSTEWVIGLSCTDGIVVQSIASDKLTGDIFVAGPFYGNCAFRTDLGPAAQHGYVIVRLRGSDGALLATHVITGSGVGELVRMGVDLDGSAIVAGNASGEVRFGSGPALLANGAFLAKFSPGSGFMLARPPIVMTAAATVGSSQPYISPRSVKVDSSNNIVLGGFYVGKIVINGRDYTPADRTGGMFVAKFVGETLAVAWLDPLPGSSVLDLATTTGNDIVVTGMLYYPTGSESIDLGTGALPGTGNEDEVFVARLSTLGEVKWAKRLGGPGFQAAVAIGVSGAHVHVGGRFTGSLGIDDFRIEQISTTGENGYVASLDYANGEPVALVRVASITGFVTAPALAVLNNGNVAVGGAFSEFAQFWNLDLASSGGADGFALLVAAN